MTQRRTELLNDTIAMLKAAGATQIRHRCNKHFVITAKYHDKPVRIVLSASPSDRKTRFVHIACVKRQLRACGRK
jgi:hypothetical protein